MNTLKKSKHGLNYVVDDELYAELLNRNPKKFDYFENCVEMSELLPTKLLTIVYFLSLFVWEISFWYALVLCLFVFLLSYPLSMVLSLYRISPIVYIFQFFEVITKFLIDMLTVIIVTVFVFHDWKYIIIYFVIRLLFAPILSMVYGYKKRSKLYNKIAEDVLKRK